MPCSRNELGFFENQKRSESLDGAGNGVSEVSKTRQVGRACLCRPGKQFGFLVSLMVPIYRILSKSKLSYFIYGESRRRGEAS